MFHINFFRFFFFFLQSGLTPLHVASFMGCMNIVIFLLQHEANPDLPTVRGETPLHLAARANQTDIIRILLRNGAQVDARARVRVYLFSNVNGNRVHLFDINIVLISFFMSYRRNKRHFT